MKYNDLQENVKKAAQVFNKYTNKQTWKNIFHKNKQIALQKLTQLSEKKQKANNFYQQKKNEVKKTFDKNKQQLEKILPAKQQVTQKGNKLLYLTMLELEKIPTNWVSDMGKYTGKFAYRFNRNRRNIALKQIKLVFPHWKKEKIVAVAQESFENLGETIFETIKKADYGKNIKNYIYPKNLEVVKKIQKTGAILVTGHFANWEFATFALEMVGLRGIFLGKEDSFMAKKIIERYRKAIGWETISVKSKNLPAKIVGVLKNKQIIYTMLDTDPREVKTLECKFFGRNTEVSSFPAKLAKKYKVPVVAFFNYRTNSKKHIFSFEILSDSADSEQQTEQELTQIYTNAIEKHIRKYPSQWRWAMSRWKKEL